MATMSDTLTSNPLSGLDPKTAITMTRVLQGVPLCEEVTVLAVETCTVLLQARNGLVLVDKQGPIHLHSPRISAPVRGQMLHRDLSKGTFVVGNLAYVTSGWKERGQVRVQPRFPIFFTIHKKGCALRASLLDLDVAGVGASADREEVQAFMSGAEPEVKLSLQLQPDLAIPSIHGTIRYTRDLSRSMTRLGIRMQPTPHQSDLLGRYVNRRREEIMRDLVDAYHAALSPAPVERLYF